MSVTASPHVPTTTGALRSIWTIAGPHRRRVASGIAWRFLQSMCTGAPFGVLVWILHEIQRSGTLPDRALWIAVGVVATSLVGALIFGYLSATASWLSSYAMVGDLRLAVLDHLRRLPMGFHLSRQRGDSTSAATSDMQMIEGFLAMGLPMVAQATGLPVVVLVVLTTVDPLMALATAVSIAASVPVFVLSNRKLAAIGIRRQDQQASVASRMLEYVQGISVIRAFNRNAAGLHGFRSAVDDFRDISVSMVKRLAPWLVGYGAILMLGVPLVLTVGTYLFFGGSLAAVDFVTMLVLLLNVYRPLLALVAVMEELRLADASLTRIDRITRESPLPEPDAPRRPESAEVRFESVDFGYAAGSPVLHDISFDCPPRTMTAVVGPSGAGKTTLLNLVGRFWDVDRGQVSIGGVDVRDMTPETLFDQLTVVFQDVYLFQGSIADNIAFGHPGATRADIERAAREAQAHDFITAFPDGYDTVVGEGGSRLSGGERQRISIARAILKDAPIVLLDEATAAVDPSNEKLIQQALARLVADKTLLVVAHKLSTIQAADQIVVLDRGRLIERGTHAQLLDRDGRYAKLWSDLTRSAGWRLTSAPAEST